jgi:phosphoribosylformimino-5-aminoimidazole carboxamide ribotide isomerase
MIIYPAIDLKDKKCVRLYQGDFANETIYDADPIALTQQYSQSGASWMHVIDLDGANNPTQKQSALVSGIIKQGVNVQTGGGIRTKQHVKDLLDEGAARIIIGSLAVTNASEVSAWLNYFGNERIILALDIIFNQRKQPIVSINGWKDSSDYNLYDLISYYTSSGLKHILCTNIELDGTLKGPDFALYALLLERFKDLHIQASGGIQALSDLKRLQKMGLAGAIIGRALYENKFTLSEALSC